MLKASALLLVLIGLLLSSALADDDNGFTCNCDDEGLLSIQTILECQRVSDFLIAVAYFSIPIELLYFVSFSNVPFKWVLVQFIAFIVLCGLTHLLNGWTYYGPHSFQLMLSLTIAKFLTALVSCATAITLLTLIPLLLKWKVRELFLRQNVLELDQEVGMMKKQKEASWHVRMLTREIRKSLDKHTILYTTLVELSKTLELHNCVVWMPNESATALNLTHELKPSSSKNSIPIKDPDVVEIKKSKGVVILRSDSVLAVASSGSSSTNDGSNPSDDQLLGAVAGIRMPLLQVSNFKGGTPEFVDTRYAILVLVLPSAGSRKWSYHEMEIVEVVADQVAVALSHAAVLEESQLMREKLGEQNRALQQARKNVVMASAARNSFEKVMSHGMRRPMHSLVGLLSILQDHETLSSEHKLLIDSMVKTTGVLSTLINDVMVLSAKNDGKFPLEMRPFQLHSLIKEASCLAKCLCIYKRFGFSVVVQSSLPDWVMGDERRTFQVILHMVGYLLDTYLEGGESVVFRVLSASNSESRNQRNWTPGMPTAGDSVFVKFEIEICSRGLASSSTSDASTHEVRYNSRGSRSNSSKLSKDSLSFTVCKKLVQMMQGDIWMASSSQGLPEKMTLVLRFPLQSIQGREYMLARRNIPENIFRGLHILLTDDDDVNRTVTKKQLEKLGCQVTAVSSGFECLSALSHTDCSFKVVFLDLYLSDMDGFEVAMRIRKFRSRNWPLIIALTASTEEQLAGKCLQAGMNGVVQKPAVLQTLADEIRRVLNRVGG